MSFSNLLKMLIYDPLHSLEEGEDILGPEEPSPSVLITLILGPEEPSSSVLITLLYLAILKSNLAYRNHHPEDVNIILKMNVHPEDDIIILKMIA
jgi:hypothetical protein